jgi:hypothetical protein
VIDMGTATFHIARVNNAWVDRGRAYEVFVNGKMRGSIRRGEQLEIEVDPGSQDVHLAVDWCRSPILSFDAEPGSEYRLRCSPAHPLMIPYAIIIGHSRYIRLERV